MKRFYLFLGLLMVANISFSQLLTENFSYTAGQLITANGWTAHSGAGTNAITVTSPGLTYVGHPGSGVGNAVTMTTSGEDDNKAFTAVSSGSVYFSFLINISAAQATGDYCIGLFQNATTFPLRVYIKSDGGTGFYFGVNKGASTPVYEATSRTFGTTYLIAANYIFNTVTTTDDVVNLWVNPALGSSEPGATIPGVTGTGTDATSIAAAFLRQGSATSASTQQIDALLVGTTWADVTPAAAIPTLSISSPLTAFGNVCTNTIAGPNSFTITGANLTTANVNVAALPGFTYSTTAGGTYTSTLSLTQPGGTYNQQVFVKFNPTAVQSYSGNIAVSGGGAAAGVNAAASGAGVNSAPTVTSGSASAITQTTATVAGSIPATGCTSVTAYGIEYSTTAGFPNGTGTAVASSNLSGGNFSSNLGGLTATTTYYYHAYATNAGGTAYGAELQFNTLSPNPTITTSALTSFGNVCTNTTAGPNSFTITGSNLTTANVSVGPLTGYTFSTTSGGTYTASLSLTQPGGSYSQQIFVKFSPVAVQSYNGNIPVAGGGIASTVNVAAVGAGVNSAPGVTTGAASAITTTTATLAGTITATGCTSVTAYGIEYSTTNGFPNGTGTQVASTNLAGGNFSSNLSGLTPTTTYYYKAYATNSGGTTYGTQQTFTTATPPPPALTATALTAFGSVCLNATAGPNSFTVNGTNLTTAAITVGPLAGYTFSETAGGTYTASLSITQTGGTQSKSVYVKFTPVAVQSYNGNIPVGGAGAPTINVAVSGSGVNTQATVVTGAATDLTNHSATVAGSVSATGCSNVTDYGIEISGINNFPTGSGNKWPSGNISAGNFSSALTGLVQGATYYYRAYATNNGGTAYGVQQSFTVPAIGTGFMLYPVPGKPGELMRITMDNINPGYYGIKFFDSDGKAVFQYNMNIQSTFINQTFMVPSAIARGTYQVQLVNSTGIVATRSIMVL